MTALHWLLLPESCVPEHDDWLAPAERASLAQLRFDRRRRDWRLGRYTARCALAADGSPLPGGDISRVAILADDDGRPHVIDADEREPCVLSLSHRAGWSLCVVAEAGVRVGCDLEVVEPRSAAFVSDYFNDREQEFVAAAASLDRARIANLVWSAKESAVKALGTGWRVDTRSAEVLAFRAGGAGEWQSLRVRCSGFQDPLEGWWRHDGEFILTTLSSPPSPAPQAVHWRVGRTAAITPTASRVPNSASCS
jgi:4'-phosphopantetheinyl transferase